MDLNNTLTKIISKITAEALRLGDKIPYIPDETGRYADTESISWWTNGFWAGMLWQLYHATENELFRKTAEASERRLDQALDGFDNIDHDAGFLWLHTAGANYRLTGSKRSERRLIHAATTLAGRYNPDLEIIRAWDGQWIEGFDTAGAAIIDTMMNLPLLYLASDITGDPRFRSVAVRHADTMLRHMLRPDGSSNHQIVFDTATGELIGKPRGQGYAGGSSWSRGQAWALYGFALSYRHTGEERYLDAAKRAAMYFIANASLTGYVPLADFRAPETPVYFDTSAGAIAACGLLEMSELVSEPEKNSYIISAERLLDAIETDWCDYGEETDGIVDGGSVSYHDERHHQKLIYGDYFFTEAVLRLLGKSFLIW
ncbi:MAG: glycoside hydrolase family 88 protein [Bacteroides sp.]|nr:glycoside hydrolase family 88 protein [Bacteroides sp.]